jgi:eukaryotic-like serine/threonine-protein kinase
MIGKTVSHYRVVEWIGRGAMGVVYKAEDTRLARPVALKFLADDLSHDPTSLERFRREARAASALNHPNICTIYDVNEREGEPAFIVMEFLKGETLKAKLQRGPLNYAELLEVATQIAAGLDAAHTEGILHRDIKSGNIFLTEKGLVKILDFGIAKLPGRVNVWDTPTGPNIPDRLTEDGVVVGTVAYMSPEQARGEELDARSDLFSLGIVLYEMATGRPAFGGGTIAVVFDAILNRVPTSPARLNPNVPLKLEEIIYKLLDKDVRLRYQSAGDLKAHLSRLSRERTVGAVSDRPFFSSPLLTDNVHSRAALAVLGFRNLVGRDESQWLSLALAEMLRTELGAGEALRIIPAENIDRMNMEFELADSDSYGAEMLALIRQNLDADFVVSGSYATVGDGGAATLRMDIRLQDCRKRQTVSLMSETGKASELFDVVSRAGARLRERLGVQAASGEVLSVRASQPTSSATMQMYVEGLMRLRSFDALGARELLERAIQSDPKFPLAYSALARTWSALGYDNRARDAAERAFLLSADLPRADRLIVEGTYREMASAWHEAIGIWQTLSVLFPDDIEHVLRLANAQIVSGAAKDGLMTIESFRSRFPSIRDPRLDLAEAAAAETLSDFKRMQDAAAAASTAGEAQSAPSLVAAAKLREGGAMLHQGRVKEAISLFEDARRLYTEAGDRGGVARALNNLAASISGGSDTHRASVLYQEGLAMARTIGNQDLVARFLNNLAIEKRKAGDLQTSLQMNQESLALRREMGDRTNVAVSLNNIGNVLLDLGDIKEASDYYERSTELSREIGDRRAVGRSLYNMAESLRLQGEIARARATAEDALRIRRGVAEPVSLASSLSGVGQIALVGGDLPTAKRLLTDALEMERYFNRQRPVAYALYYLGEAALVEGELEDARRLHQEALGIRTQLGEKGTAAESRTALAVLALEEGRPGDAEALARDAASVFEAQAALNNQAIARAVLALAMAAQNLSGPAIHEIERARSLVRQTQNVLARIPVEIAAARIKASVNDTAAVDTLERLCAEAVERGIPRWEFEARRALADILGARSPDAAAESRAQLRKDAAARGFRLYAR